MKVIKNTDVMYPKRLLQIKNAPEKLYIEGNVTLLNHTSLAIVGSRNCSEYGINNTKKFAKEIAKNDVTIVSGLAVGIDTVAHEVSKECKGKTIAVLGCGLNCIYPSENKKLVEGILKNEGCIVSEYEPEEKINMKNFPKRNRIVSGMAMGVLVIEARYGFEQNKKVFCLPRDIGVSNGIGTNELIRKGAILVTKPEEVLQELEITYEKESIELTTKIIKKEYQKVYDAISYVPQTIQEIKRKSHIDIIEINQQLMILELEGHIISLPGNRYMRR